MIKIKNLINKMHLKAKPPVSMITKSLRKLRDNLSESRSGNRGGRDQFKWDDIKQMSYKDRECYLGYTSKIGYLDKGGKWKTGDWYKNGERKKKIKKNEIDKKKEEVKRKEKERMEIALGLRKKDEDQKQVQIDKFSSKQTVELTNRIQDFDKEESRGTYGLGYKKNYDHNYKKVDLSKNYNCLKGNI